LHQQINRFPTFTELYYNRGGAIGSIDLKPEIAMCYELGAEIKYKSFQFQGALFARNGNNLIDWVRLNGSSITTATNLTKVLYYGLDANMKYVPTKIQSGVIKQIVFGVLIMKANNNSSGFESNYALDFIQYKLTSGLRFAFNKKLNANLLVYAQNRRGGFFKPGSTSETPFGWNMSADVRISYTIKKTSLFLEGTNLLNNNLTDIGNVILPGRWIKGGLNITL
jgi:iron complex outermembrane receptor protein